MVITEEDGQTVIDGEAHTTFIKAEQLGKSALDIHGTLTNLYLLNFRWIALTRNPFKDCWILLRWYFRKSK